jgi:hypothetical protein
MSELSDLFDALATPDHEPDFWSQLEAQLATQPSPIVDAATIASTPEVDTEVGDGDADLRELHHWRARRWVIATAAAAAIAAIILGLNALTEDTGPAPTITDITTSTTTTITVPPPDADASPGPAIDVSRQLEWTRQTSNLTARGYRTEAVAADEVFYALDGGLTAAPSGLLRSADALVWESIDASSMRVGDRTPSWSTDTGVPDFMPVALAVNGQSVSVAEITHASNGITPNGRGAGDPAGLRIWRSDGGEDWSLVDFPVFDPPVDARVSMVQEVRIAESPDTLVVVRTLNFEIDWWQFAPEGLEFDNEAHNEVFGYQVELALDSDTRPATATRAGVKFSWLPDDPITVWADLPPEAEEAYDWRNEAMSNGVGRKEYYAVESDGDVTRLHESAPLLKYFSGVRWSGTRFVVLGVEPSRFDDSYSVAFSTDGQNWSEPTVMPGSSAYGFEMLDDSLFVNTDRGLLVSTDLGVTYGPVDVDLPGWGPARETRLEDGSILTAPTWEFFFGGLTVQHGVAMGVVGEYENVDGDGWLIRSTDGLQWTSSRLDATAGVEVEGGVGVVIEGGPLACCWGFVFAGPDGTTYVYSSDGTVDIGQPTG